MTVTINGTTGIAGVDGSAATPAAQGADTNTGIFYGTDIVGVSTGGTERMRIDSSGNVGIGTSSPRAPLSFSNSVGTAGVPNRIRFYDDGGSTVFGFGLSSGQLSYNCADGSHVFYTGGTSPTERMRIDSSGNIIVKPSSGSYTYVAGESGFLSDNGYGNLISLGNTYGIGKTYINFRNGTSVIGQIISNSASTVQYATSSDYRLKENIQPMQGALAVVSQLNPVTYTWKADGSDGQGFIAHELQAVVPDCVTGEKDAVDEEGKPVYQGIDTSFLVATLTKAIQELSAKNDALEARLAALEAK